MMPWLDRLAAVAGRLAGTRGAVLCFHGLEVGEEASPSSMHVSHTHLEAIVDSIGASRLAPLQDLVTRHLAGRGTAGMVAITADDAYASWLAAEPLLNRMGIPLTIFAVSNALEAGSRFWWDRIEDAAATAPPERWHRFEADCGLPEAYRRGQPTGEGLVRPLRQWVLAEYAGRWPPALEAPLARLEQALGRSTPQRSMTGVELAGFVERTGAQVGVHTVSHAALPFLPDQSILAEVGQGYEDLCAKFRGTLPYLAIPFGLFDARTLRLSAEAGMAVSLTLEGQPLDQPFAADVGVPRLCVVREQGPGKIVLKTSAVARLYGYLQGDAHSHYPDLPSPTI